MDIILADAFERYYTVDDLHDLQSILSNALGRCSLNEQEYNIGDDMFKDISRILKKEKRLQKLIRIENAIKKENENILPINIQPDGLPDIKWSKQVRKLRLLKNISIRLH